MATKDSWSFRLPATPVTVLAHVLAGSIITLVLVWSIHFRGGLAFKSHDKQKIFIWLLGFISFFFPGVAMSTRARLVLWHWFFGMVIFLMGISTAEMGLAERFLFLRLQHGQEALIVNITGLLILLFAVAVSLSVVLPRSTQNA